MFYPAESLKKGGRFYLCWLGDSWPQRFKCTHNRQIMSQDIVQICDDLLEVIIQESGRPSQRFSLRLSSQLLCGLVRIFKRKANILLNDLCMIESHIMHNINKRNLMERVGNRQQATSCPVPRLMIEEVGEEERVEELLQNNMLNVARIEDITMREPTLPEYQIANDGFGEFNLELPVISNQTLEIMLGPDASAVQHSAVNIPFEPSPSRLADQTDRLRPDAPAHVEQISERGLSMLDKTGGAELQAPGDFEREIPEMTDIPIPDPKEAHGSKQVVTNMEIDDIIQLQEIPDEAIASELVRHRRRIVTKDAQTMFSAAYMQSRVKNVKVELRCQDFRSGRIVSGHTEARRLLHEPTCANKRKTALPITRIYFNRLMNLERRILLDIPEKEIAERERQYTGMEHHMPPSEIEERQVTRELEIPNIVLQTIEPMDCEEEQNMSVLPAQEIPSPAKRIRIGVTNIESTYKSQIGNKENLPPNQQFERLSKMLQDSGILEIPERVEPQREVEQTTFTRNSADSEEPLGSLDRTRVSLGDSNTYTDVQKFIRLEWNTFNTIIRIVHNESMYNPFDLDTLLSVGPVPPGHCRYTVAKCFSSLLKLKQHGFIVIEKRPTKDIQNIHLGPKLDNYY